MRDFFVSEGRTNGQADSRSRMNFDPDACVYDADMNDAYIHGIHLILMQVCVMHISVILDPDVHCYDAYAYDAYICEY